MPHNTIFIKKIRLTILILLLGAFIMGVNAMHPQYAVIWTFMLVPVMLVILLHPYWIVTHLAIWSAVTVKYVTVFFIHDQTIAAHLIDDHLIASVVNLTVIYTFALIRIYTKGGENHMPFAKLRGGSIQPEPEKQNEFEQKVSEIVTRKLQEEGYDRDGDFTEEELARAEELTKEAQDEARGK